jgi:hypothetical protein
MTNKLMNRKVFQNVIYDHLKKMAFIYDISVNKLLNKKTK